MDAAADGIWATGYAGCKISKNMPYPRQLAAAFWAVAADSEPACGVKR